MRLESIENASSIRSRANFFADHAFSCAKGGFTSTRHNEIGDLTASTLTKVPHIIQIEPELQPVTSEGLTGAFTDSRGGAWMAIGASGV